MSKRVVSMTKLFTLGLGLVLAAGIGARAAHAAGAADDHTVLILGPTVSGGAGSVEATKAMGLGLTVEVVDAAGWTAKSSADFSTYRALILGDPDCSSLGPQQAAQDTVATWGPVVDGNVIMIGTDEFFHDGQGGNKVSAKAVAFASSEVGKTGAMVSLSCYYHGTAPLTPVPLLDAFAPGGFTVTGVGCYNNAHIVADHPAITCPPGSPAGCDPLTDTDISNWSCSVHEAFDTWPADFVVLAMAKDIGTVFTATDGTTGTPYIIARGESLRTRGLSLTPASDTNPTTTDHTLTAELRDPEDNPVAGSLIGFHVITGPNMGAAGTCNPADCLTDATGHVTFTYTGAGGVGEDTIEAFVDANANGTADPGEARTTAKKTWIIFDPFGGITKTSRRDLTLKLHRPDGADGVRCVETGTPDAPDFDSIPFTMFPEGTDDIELPIELTAPFGDKTVCCQFASMDIPILQPVCDAVTLDTGTCEGKPEGAACSVCPEGSPLSEGTCDASGACSCQPEICGDCIDNDNNGLTDYEDPACCPTASTAGMTVKKAKFGGGSVTNGRVRLKTVLAKSGFQVNPRSENTTVQMRNANGELFCHTITAPHWMKRSKVQSQFWTKDPAVGGGLTDGSIFTKSSGQARFRTKGRLNLTQYNASPLTVTVYVGAAPTGGKCSSGVVTLKKKGAKLVGP
jgi:hypothetical protein